MSSLATPASPLLSVLMPVRDEGVNIPITIRILSAAIEVPHEILVVYDRLDDDSIEPTYRMQQRFPQVRLVHNSQKPGICQALKAGVAEANGQYVLVFAVDEVGPVIAIDSMLALMERGCDLVSCTRYRLGGRRLGGSLPGGVLSRLANALFRRVGGGALSDSTTGIKMFRRDRFDELELESQVGWAVAFELAIKAQLAGFQLGEVPIVSIDRLYGGTSSFSVGPWLIEYLRWFRWGQRALRQAPAAHVWTPDKDGRSSVATSRQHQPQVGPAQAMRDLPNSPVQNQSSAMECVQ